MNLKRRLSPIWYRVFVAVLCVILISALLSTTFVFAQEPHLDTIKVGCFPYSDLLQVDKNGNYSGYGYDYLQEIARYTGWHYQFVHGTWDQCLTMLEKGEIDLMGAVMRSDERELRFDFSQSPMISGYGVLATLLNNEQLPYEDYEAFDGLAVGAVRGNQHAENFLEFSRKHKFTPVLHIYNSQAEMETALATGAIDAIVMSDILCSNALRMVATFGENDAYFATTKGNTAVLTQLNQAMRQIRLQNPYFNSKLEQKYYALQAAAKVSFTREELEFVKNSPSIPCVYIPGAPPFTTYDKSTKRVQGIAVDVLAILEERTGLRFEWFNPESAEQAVDMLRTGQALLLPAKYDNLSWAEQNHVQLTEPYLFSQMIMVTGGRSASNQVIATYGEDVQGGLTAYAMSDDAQLKEYATIIDCMDAVLNGEADATFVNATIASYLLNKPKYANLQTTSLYNFPADISIAASEQADPLLLSVLNKGLDSISATEMNQIIMVQMKKGQVGPVELYFHQHPIEIVMLIMFVFAVLIVTLLLLLRKMKRNLYTDALTGYLNYNALCRDAAKLINGHPEQFAIVYMDIRRFKAINDTYGYDTGDCVLVATANVLHRFIAQDERMARIHADTFVLLLQYNGQQSFQLRLDNLSEKLEAVFGHHKNRINPLFRGGVYPLSEGYESLERACDRANSAKDSIHQLFANTFVFYDDVIHSRVLAEKELEDSMKTALVRHEFVPYYQPKVNAITGQVVGAEALARWNHPEKGWLSPAEFIPFYEQNGFIVEIDMAIFEHVCKDLQQWLESGQEGVPVSVNFSRRNIQKKELPQKLREIAAQYQIPTRLLEIEVTETEELENTEIAINFVNGLKECGFSVSIDDYGTGYSSISFLQQLPLDTLKLDRQFVLNAMKSNQARDIMLHLVSAMQKNKIRILCEGIENEEQRAFVISLNCQFIQGFLYSKPLPRADFEVYLLQHGADSSDSCCVLPQTEGQ